MATQREATLRLYNALTAPVKAGRVQYERKVIDAALDVLKQLMVAQGYEFGPPESETHKAESLALDAIYAAWHGAGVDIAGGNWKRFAGMLPSLYLHPSDDAKLREDAERYRWFRSKVSANTRKTFHLEGIVNSKADLWKGSVAEHFDAAIDAARAAEGGR